MKKYIQKRPSITRKIERLFRPPKGKQPHKLYPEKYFKRFWLNRQDSNGVTLVAKFKGITQKEAAHIIAYWGVKHIMGELVKEQIDLMDTPEGRAGQAKRTRFYHELRKLCKEQGWDIHKLF